MPFVCRWAKMHMITPTVLHSLRDDDDADDNNSYVCLPFMQRFLSFNLLFKIGIKFERKP